MKQIVRAALMFTVAAGIGCGSPAIRTELMYPIPASCPRGVSVAGQKSPVLPLDPHLKVATYNLDLAPGIQRLVKPRIRPVAEAVARELERSDVVCLQEVWQPESREAIRQVARSAGVSILEYDSRGQNEDGRDRCKASQLRSALKCVREKCSHEADEDVTICGQEKCYWKLVWLYLWHRHCLNCLVSNVGHSVKTIINRCVNGPGASRVYGGDNGIMMLSRRPVRHVEALPLPASGTNRVALMASVEAAPGHWVEVACTHLSSQQRTKPTHPAFKSWKEEQGFQIKAITRRLQVRAKGRPQLLVGDMNFGQKHRPGVNQVMWASWKRACRAGYISPAEHAKPPLCSFCKGNLLNGTKAKVLIDHVLIRHGQTWSLEPLCAERVFDQPIAVIDRKGKKRQTSLSDHYGIRVEFRVGPIPVPYQPPNVRK